MLAITNESSWDEQGGCSSLAEVRLQEGESLENALRRFKRKVQTEDIIKEVKRHSFYLKPGEEEASQRSAGSQTQPQESAQGTGLRKAGRSLLGAAPAIHSKATSPVVVLTSQAVTMWRTPHGGPNPNCQHEGDVSLLPTL
jgi:ribosomal protein S21